MEVSYLLKLFLYQLYALGHIYFNYRFELTRVTVWEYEDRSANSEEDGTSGSGYSISIEKGWLGSLELIK